MDVASYSYDPVKRELVSYDVPDTVRIKAEYVRAKALAGCMFWEVRRLSGGRVCVVARCALLIARVAFFCVCAVRQLSSDKTGTASLVYTAGVTLGQLDQTPVRRAHLLHLG